jgi:hypothetical protein
MLWYARSQRCRASSRSSVARRIRHSRFIISSVPPDLGRRICRAACELIAPRRRRLSQAPRAAEGESTVPAHTEFVFCDQSIERTNSWSNAHKKLMWCTERVDPVIDFWLAFSGVIITVGRLVREGRIHYRWEGRPYRRP